MSLTAVIVLPMPTTGEELLGMVIGALIIIVAIVIWAWFTS